MVFASTLFSRAVDPIIPRIAADIGVDVKTVALLSTAFTLPYAIMQPALGTIGDFFGKTRLMNISLAMVAVTTLVCAFAGDFSVLVTMRILAGMLAGGIFPIGIAIVGDLVPVDKRQVAIGRVLAVGLTGNLIGATISGVISDLFGWRAVFFSIGAFGLIVAIVAFFAFRELRSGESKPFKLATAIAGFRGIFRDPRAKVCFGAVFVEAIIIHGMFPFVAVMLLASGAARSSYAGLVIGAFGAGGILFSLSLPFLVAHVAQRHMMLAGAGFASIAFILIALNLVWYLQVLVFLVFGIGFYMLHNCIQLHVTDLTQTARGAALSLHSASFFFGQAIGPIYYGYAFEHFGLAKPPLVGAVVILVIGLVCARFLRHRRDVPLPTSGPAERQ
ncbi:MAG TPA: MFS transporter [Xanthobacteraceae bacterium]|nr:MFS transporter [Xanthobacteraceae bacterium]